MTKPCLPHARKGSPSRTTIAALAAAVVPTVAIAGGLPTTGVDEVYVYGQLDSLEGMPVSATQGVVLAEQFESRPLLRAGELLEVVPGLIVTQHSGDGKANQYFLRGFNLDHGTDLATTVDGVPVNMPTHGHGQGYTDVNFVIPELVQAIEYRKGTYYADTGNFSAAGAVELRYRERLDGSLVTIEAGEYNARRAVAATGLEAAGGNLLAGVEYAATDGPWELDEDLRRINALVKYTRPTADGELGLSFQAYDGRWDSTDQIPRRAVDAGVLDRYGFIDPTSGGESHRYSLYGNASGRLGAGSYEALVYGLDYRLQLFSNFSYFLNFPDDGGDQFEQFDDRRVYGGKAAWTLPLEWATESSLELGTEIRYDDIDTVGLYNTVARQRRAGADGTVREDSVTQASYSLYSSLETRWTPMIRTILGLRADRFEFDVNSNIAANSGSENDAVVNPKAALVVGPWRETEFFANVGKGFHSNDARGTTIVVDPTDGVTPVDPVDPLVDALGTEVGLRTALLPRTQLSIALWQLKLDSELLFVGDAGVTEPNRKSERRGVEFSAIWSPLDWMVLDLDLAWTRARFDDNDPEGIGSRIPGAVDQVVALGVSVDHPTGWSGGLRFRHFGSAPLIEDNSARSDPTTLVNLELGYRLTSSLKATVALLNAFGSKDNDITYYYESQLAGEVAPVEDFHFHPVEPRTLRVSLTGSF